MCCIIPNATTIYNSKCHDLSLSPEAEEPEVVQLSALPPMAYSYAHCPFVHLGLAEISSQEFSDTSFLYLTFFHTALTSIKQ